MRRGERIAQMIVAPVSRVRLDEVSELSRTDRGAGGFGHTGPLAMPLSFCLLGSGSKATHLYQRRDGAVLVDAGLSAKQCMVRMEARGLDPGRIRAIVITHEHADHVKGARVLAKRLKVPVWASQGTWKQVGDLEGAERCLLKPGRGLKMGAWSCIPF